MINVPFMQQYLGEEVKPLNYNAQRRLARRYRKAADASAQAEGFANQNEKTIAWLLSDEA